MTERAGCISGARGFGARKFKGVVYGVYGVYLSEQPSGFDRDAQDLLIAENTALMEQDKKDLKAAGRKTRTITQQCGQLHILYVMRGEAR